MEFDNDRQIFYLYVNNTTGNLFEKKKVTQVLKYF